MASDTIKLNLSGEYIAGIRRITPMSDAEIAVASRRRGCAASGWRPTARSCGSVKQCVRHGVDLIYHASFTDEEALDLLEAHKTSTSSHPASPG